MKHIITLDNIEQFKRVNIYKNDFNEYVLRCFKDGINLRELNYHTNTEQDAINEANNFLKRKG